MKDELGAYLNTLQSGDSYRAQEVLKEADCEVTERVFLVGHSGEELGPFIRKRIRGFRQTGQGQAYVRIWEAQQAGKRFTCVPYVLRCQEKGDTLTVVMEDVPGPTLEAFVHALQEGEAGAPLHVIAPVFVQLCDAVSQLHESFEPPLIHRDLKPSNVVVSSGAVTLIDLGIARSYDCEKEQDTTHFGTVSYAPPEQFGFAQTDVRSDVYALGMVLFFCLTGQQPGTPVAALQAAEQVMPVGVLEVFKRATRLDPAERYPNARALREAFQAVVQNAPAGVAQAPLPVQCVQTPVQPAQAPIQPEQTPVQPGVSVNRGLSLFDRMPVQVGVLWNAVLLLTGVLFFAATTAVVFSPEESNRPFYAVFLIGYGFFVAAPLFLTYPFFDKRRIQPRLMQHFPRLGALSFKQQLLWCVGLAVGVLALVFALVLVGSVISALP